MIAWLTVHPSDIEQIALLFFDGNYKRAAYCLNRLYMKKKVRRLDGLQIKDEGRHRYLFCKWWPNTLAHEWFLTWFCMLYPEATFQRGYKMEREADAIMQLGGKKFFIEFDAGNMREKKVKERWKKYKDCADPLLIVVQDLDNPDATPKRINKLIEWGQSVDKIALYLPLSEARKKPLGAVWADGGGQGISLGEIIGRNG